MEGQPFFTSVAALAVSLAGFGSVIAWLRDDQTGWDAVNLWRVKTIVRHALTLAFLCLALIPVFSLTEDDMITIRAGSGLILVLALTEMWSVRRPDPVVWSPRRSWVVSMVVTSVIVVLAALNLVWASLGVLQVVVLTLLSSPAGIFSNFVREMGTRPSTAGPEASD